MSDKQSERLQKLVENPNLSNWEKGFITSVNSYFQKHGRVSNKQWATIQKVEANYSPEVIAQRQAWNSSFTDEMRRKWDIAMDYYENNPPYFQDLVTRYRVSPEMIPTAKLYNKIVENKYVQNVIATIQSEPLYEVGCLVQVRRTAKGPHYRFRDCIALVVDNSGPVTSATKGAKTYSILPFGETAPVKIQERWLKKKRG
tara:strand:- start:81 stop:680 length:600 start_codon:yes stop_codon:yes gene_type:complete